MKKIVLFIVLVISLIVISATFTVSAEAQEPNYGLIDDGYVPNFPEENYISLYTDFPSRYDPREINATTPVKDQDRLGTCWAFASIGTMEQAVYKQTGLKYDYSEESLRYALSNKLAAKVQKSVPDMGFYIREYYGYYTRTDIKLNGNLLYKITDGDGNVLYQDRDYLLTDNAANGYDIRFSATNSYLADLEIGESRNIVFEFTDGENQTLVITRKINIPYIYVTGIFAYGQVLSTTLVDDYGVNATNDVSYQWQRRAEGGTWTNIEGANESTYTIKLNDVGKYLRVFITGKEDGAYFHAQTRSNGTGNIIIIIYGDVDLDGEVSYNDATLVSQYVNNMVQLSTQQMVLADVNGDGYVDNDDATLIVSYVNGNINQFPVEY